MSGSVGEAQKAVAELWEICGHMACLLEDPDFPPHLADNLADWACKKVSLLSGTAAIIEEVLNGRRRRKAEQVR